jgi:spoIIIJ-associated protein
VIDQHRQEHAVSDENVTDNVTEGTEPTPTDGTEPDSTEPDSTEPDNAEPDSTEPDSAGSETETAGVGGTDDAAQTETPSGLVEQLEREGDIAADYLEELLDIADLDGDLDLDVEADRAAVSIVGADLDQLVGRDGEVLEALQELTRLAVYRETGERSRLMLDISGHRAGKRAALERLAAETVDRVRESGEPVALDPMTPFERKVVHDAVAAAGLRSESENEEPRRHVVVLPA